MMDKSAFNELIGLKLSVATSKLKESGIPESYVGFLEKVGEDYIILDYAKASTNRANTISKVILLLSTVVGVWVYE